MSRLDSEQDLAEIRLRLDVGGGVGVRKITRDDVRRLLEEVAECWEGNLPEWTGLCEAEDYDEDYDPPYSHITRIEEFADRAQEMALGGTDGSAAWLEISQRLYDLLEDIEDDDPCCIENKEEARCDTADVLCREAGGARCVHGPNPSGPAPA